MTGGVADDGGGSGPLWSAERSAGSGFGSESAERGGQVLVEGTTFVLSGPGGDIEGAGDGLFVRDARVVSR